MSILQFTDGTTISIESQIERLALEANFLSNAVERFRDIMPNLTMKISDLSGLIADAGHHKFNWHFTNNLSSLNAKFKYVSFNNYEKLIISVPEGFKGNFLDYVETLNNMSNGVYSDLNSVLSEYNAMLSTFITNKDDKISVQDQTAFFKKIEKNREAMVAKLQVFFPTSGSTSKSYLSMAIGRFSDLEPLVKDTEKLKKTHCKQNIADTSKTINKCVDLLSIILNDLDHGNIDKVSGPSSMNIATGCYEVGKFVEFMTVYRYKSEQIMTSVDKLIVQLNNILK